MTKMIWESPEPGVASPWSQPSGTQSPRPCHLCSCSCLVWDTPWLSYDLSVLNSVKHSMTGCLLRGCKSLLQLTWILRASLRLTRPQATCVCVDRSAAAAAKSLQSCPTLCDPIDCSPPGSPAPGILQARTLEWVAISFPNAWKWKVKVKSLSCVCLFSSPWTAAYQVPPSMGFSTFIHKHCCHFILQIW